MSKSPYKILVRPILTERSMEAQNEPVLKPRPSGLPHSDPKGGKYTFQVSPDANKREIRTAVEKAFNVKVMAVNTVNCEGKAKRMRTIKMGKRADWKKAVVTLAPGQRIDFTT